MAAYTICTVLITSNSHLRQKAIVESNGSSKAIRVGTKIINENRKDLAFTA